MNTDWHARMAQYEQELLNLRNRSRPEPSITTPPTPPPDDTTLHLRIGSETEKAPIHSAIVTVEKQTPNGRLPLYVRFSDRHGQVEPLLLPYDPPVQYVITAAAPGYARHTAQQSGIGGEALHWDLWLRPLSAHHEEGYQ